MKIVVAIGGSILLKEYDCKKFQEYSEILKSLASEHEIFVVVGGGKPAREYIGVVRELGAGEAQCDDIGIEVTRINAKLLLSALGDAAYQKVPHNFQEALEYSATGKIIVMGGTEPAHSTDAVSAILAEYIHADKLINLTSVDGMYYKDPNKYEDAKLIKEITASEMIEFISSLGDGVKKIQLLKYHSLGKMKYQWIGKECVEFEEPDELYREHILSKMRELPFYVEWN